MKKKWKTRLIPVIAAIATIIVLAEFEKWMKNRAEPCVSGICPVPHDHGLVIDPFPDEIVPPGLETNKPTPASGHPSGGGELNNGHFTIPSTGGVRKARGGLFPAASLAANSTSEIEHE